MTDKVCWGGRENRDAFWNAIQEFRVERAQMTVNQEEEELGEGEHVQVVCRKRPIFTHEMEQGEFDVVTCGQRGKGVTIHDSRMVRSSCCLLACLLCLSVRMLFLTFAHTKTFVYFPFFVSSSPGC